MLLSCVFVSIFPAYTPTLLNDISCSSDLFTNLKFIGCNFSIVYLLNNLFSQI